MPVHVAVGVIRGADGRILLSRRAEDSHQGGLWEFPGGKVELGETVLQALGRELAEELGIVVERVERLIEVHHDYGDEQVHLDVWWVTAFSGKPVSREGQPLSWVAAHDLPGQAFPAANLPIVEAVLAGG